MPEYKDRSQTEIYNNIKTEYDDIDGLLGNGNRDDEDVYQAAMRVINRYFSEDFADFDENNRNLIRSNDDTSKFVFSEYKKLYDQLKIEHDNLEAKGTKHYIWTSVEPHMQRLAGRINGMEYKSLINRHVHDAKFELIYGNKMIEAEETSPGHSNINTWPLMTKETDGKKISEVLEYTRQNNPNINPEMTYTIDYTMCSDEKLRDLGILTVNSEGKLITKGENQNFNIDELPAGEGVRIASSKYLDALGIYNKNKGIDIDKYSRPGGVNEVTNENFNKLLTRFGGNRSFDSFDEVIANLSKDKYTVHYTSGNSKEVENDFKDSIQLLNTSPSLLNLFKRDFERTKDCGMLYEFLAATETKLDHVVKKNKLMGFALSQVPIEKTSPGLVQANFVGDVDINGGIVREVLFRDVDSDGLTGQRCDLSHELYTLLDNNRSEFVNYLKIRIQQKWGDGRTAEYQLRETTINSSDTVDVEEEKGKKDYEIKQYQLERFLSLCNDFSNKFGEDEDYQPAQLVKIGNYLENVSNDLYNNYTKSKKLPTKEKWNEISKKIQEYWIDFKDNDGNSASMTDSYACILISKIFNANDKNTVQVCIKELGNGMTLFDNTTGSEAVSDALSDSRNTGGEPTLKIDKQEFDKCRIKINTDFQINTDDNGVVVDENGNPIPKEHKDNIDAILNAYKDSWKNTDVLNYLKGNGYLPKKAKIDDDKVKDACDNILEGLKSKMELLNSNSRKLTPESMKEKLKEEQEKLRRRNTLTDEDLAFLNGIDAMLEDDAILNEHIEKQNTGMMNAITYGDMQELMAGSVTRYLVKEGGGVSLRGSKGKSAVVDMINDSYGIGFLNFSDENCEKIGPILKDILIEVAICAVAIAAGAVTAGAGTAAILALRATAFGARAIKVANTVRRARCIAKLCKYTCTSAKYIGRIGNKLKQSRRFKPIVTRGTTELVTESSRIGRAAASVEEYITSSKLGLKAWKSGETIGKIIRTGNEARKIGSTGMRVAGFLLEGTGFHVTNTAIHNMMNGQPIGQGLNPFGNTEYINPETGETVTVPNFRGYVESIAFLGVLKMVGAPFQNLSQNAMKGILGKTASADSRLAKFFATGGSIIGEMGSLGMTDQVLSLAFDQKLKNITVEDFIHSFGMVLGLRMTRSIGGAYKKYVVSEYNKAKGEVVIEADGKVKFRVNTDGTIVQVTDMKGKPIENSEYKGKNLYLEKTNGPKDESENELFNNYVKEKESQLRRMYKRLYQKELGVDKETLEKIIREKSPIKRENFIKDITDETSRKFIQEEFIEHTESFKELTQYFTKFLDSNLEIKAKIESGKFEFLGKDIEELYKRGLDATLEGKPKSQHESLIFDFNTRFANSLEFLSDKESSVKFLDSKTGKLVEGTITDYGKSLLGENFESSPTKKAFFDKLKSSMFYQHLDNPLKYCSHGADHSILVDRYVQNIVESYPDVVNKVQEKYGVNEEGARQLLRLTAVFHDFGYPDIGGLAKAMHGPFGGAHFINEFASSSNSTFTDFIKNDLGITDQTKIDQLVNDMKDAIFFHSADKVEKGYLNKIKYTKGTFLLGDDFSAKGTDDFIEILNRESDGAMTITYRSKEGRINAENFKKMMLEKYPKLDENKIKIEEDSQSYDYDNEFDYKKDGNGEYILDENGDKIRLYEYHGRKGKTGDSGIEFQPIDLLEEPLAGIVRLADNMDMSLDRLTKIQSHPIFMNLFYNIGYEYKLENGKTNTETTSYIYQKMEKLNKLEGKKQISKEEYDSKSEKDRKDYITQEDYKIQHEALEEDIKSLIKKANENGGLEITIFDERTGRPKEGSTFRRKFDENLILKDGKVDLYTYKQFIINEMSKKMDDMGIEYDHDAIQTIQNIAIDNDIGSYSFRHFIGLTPIKDVTIESSRTSKRLVVKVDKDIYLNTDLRSQKLTEGSFVDRPVVEYHIRRLFDASGRVTVGKKANYHGLLQLTIIDSQTGELIGQGSRLRPDEEFNIKYEDNIHIPDQIIEGGEID